MRIEVKLTGALYDRIMHDLVRPHPFAAERVGFVFARVASLADQGKLILLDRYHSIPDEQYVDDPAVGARIGGETITWAMQAVYYGRAACEGIFHIHLHAHNGETGMSNVDRDEIPKLIPGFQSVGREAAHGIIILSRDHGSAWVWLPGSKEVVHAVCVSVIGVPVGVFERRIPK
ncbi:MAG: hypothetical protein ACLQU1_38440 [Bryobacteraceae bacterium]